MKTINKIAFSKLSNAYHVSFLFAINQLNKEFKQKAYSNLRSVTDYVNAGI